MDEVKRGLVMIFVPVAVLFLVYGMFTAGTGIYWVQAVAALLLICTCFLGGWSFAIGLIHLISGRYSVLRARYLARVKNA